MLQEEFRKSGQPASVTSRTADILTFFQMGANAEPGKRVLIIRGMPSTLIWSGEQICKGAIFVAEHFISPDMHGKIFTVGKQAFEETQPPRLYFALEDGLFEIYSEDVGFEKLFKVIDFIEKYDHWKQIRRVFAKSMVTVCIDTAESLTEELVVHGFVDSFSSVGTGKSVSKKKHARNGDHVFLRKGSRSRVSREAQVGHAQGLSAILGVEGEVRCLSHLV